MQSDRAERLEAGEILRLAPCPFPLPEGEEREFLFQQRLRPQLGKYIHCDVSRGQVHGLADRSPATVSRLATILLSFSQHARAWLKDVLPAYAEAAMPDRVTWRTEEEATRHL